MLDVQIVLVVLNDDLERVREEEIRSKRGTRPGRNGAAIELFTWLNCIEQHVNTLVQASTCQCQVAQQVSHDR